MYSSANGSLIVDKFIRRYKFILPLNLINFRKLLIGTISHTKIQLQRFISKTVGGTIQKPPKIPLHSKAYNL